MSLISNRLRDALREEGWLKVAAPLLEQENFVVPEDLSFESLGYAFGNKLAQEILNEDMLTRGLLAHRMLKD